MRRNNGILSLKNYIEYLKMHPIVEIKYAKQKIYKLNKNKNL